MFRYLIFNGLKFQLNFICLGFGRHDITIITWFWLEVVTEKSTHGGGEGGRTLFLTVQFSSGGGGGEGGGGGATQYFWRGYYLIFRYLKPIFQPPPPPPDNYYCAVPYMLFHCFTANFSFVAIGQKLLVFFKTVDKGILSVETRFFFF